VRKYDRLLSGLWNLRARAVFALADAELRRATRNGRRAQYRRFACLVEGGSDANEVKGFCDCGRSDGGYVERGDGAVCLSGGLHLL
jgi:hypothetical protein